VVFGVGVDVEDDVGWWMGWRNVLRCRRFWGSWGRWVWHDTCELRGASGRLRVTRKRVNLFLFVYANVYGPLEQSSLTLEDLVSDWKITCTL
jgi:hypothetical protein